ncbi:MAG: hypothetical protein ACLUQY_00715 [Weissella confusa]
MKGVKVIGAVALVFLLGFGGAMAWNTVADGRHATQEEMTQSKSSKSTSSVSSKKSSASKSTVDSQSQSSASSSSDTAASATPAVKSETSEVTASQSSSSQAQPAASVQTAPSTANTSQDAINAVIAYERANGGLSSDVTTSLRLTRVRSIKSKRVLITQVILGNEYGWVVRYDATTGQVTHMDQ